MPQPYFQPQYPAQNPWAYLKWMITHPLMDYTNKNQTAQKSAQSYAPWNPLMWGQQQSWWNSPPEQRNLSQLAGYKWLSPARAQSGKVSQPNFMPYPATLARQTAQNTASQQGRGGTGGTGQPPGSVTQNTVTQNTTQQAAKPTTQVTKVENPQGAIYHQKVSPGTTSYVKPLIFPGVETSSGSWAKYQDGSFIDYSSVAWQKASAYQPPADYADLWKAIPDSWKANIAQWDKAFIEQWLAAVSHADSMGYFAGQQMTGAEAAKQIQKMAGEALANQSKANKAAQAPQGITFKPNPYFVPSAY